MDELKSLEDGNRSQNSYYEKHSTSNEYLVNVERSEDELSLLQLKDSSKRAFNSERKEQNTSIGAKYMKELYEKKMEQEKTEISKNLSDEKVKNSELCIEIKILENDLREHFDISHQLEMTKVKIDTLTTQMDSKEAYYQYQIESLHKDYKKQITDKNDQITFLRNKQSQTVQDLQNEIFNRDNIITTKVEVIKKQREEDLRTFIESKEDLEKKMNEEKDLQLKK
jgi:hypothetical protein